MLTLKNRNVKLSGPPKEYFFISFENFIKKILFSDSATGIRYYVKMPVEVGNRVGNVKTGHKKRAYVINVTP